MRCLAVIPMESFWNLSMSPNIGVSSNGRFLEQRSLSATVTHRMDTHMGSFILPSSHIPKMDCRRLPRENHQDKRNIRNNLPSVPSRQVSGASLQSPCDKLMNTLCGHLIAIGCLQLFIDLQLYSCAFSCIPRLLSTLFASKAQVALNEIRLIDVR